MHDSRRARVLTDATHVTLRDCSTFSGSCLETTVTVAHPRDNSISARQTGTAVLVRLRERQGGWWVGDGVGNISSPLAADGAVAGHSPKMVCCQMVYSICTFYDVSLS